MFTPGDAENVPGLHAEHALTPLAFEKLPTSHLKQSLAFAAEKFPAAQGTHELLRCASQAEPASHVCAQEPPLSARLTAPSHWRGAPSAARPSAPYDGAVSTRSSPWRCSSRP